MKTLANAKLKLRARGQAVVEFALVMIFFLLVLLTSIDLGRAWFTVVAVEHAAAEGALFGLVYPQCTTAAVPGCADPNNIEYRAKNESQDRLIDADKMTITVTCNPSHCPPGGMITVAIVYDYELIVPALSAFGADTIPIRRVATQLIATAPEE